MTLQDKAVENTDKKINLKMFVDIAVGIFVLIFLICPWLGVYEIATLKRYSGYPLPIIIMLIDCFPFIFSVIWLLSKYSKLMLSKWPMFFRLRVPYLIIVFIILLPTFLIKYNWR